MPTFKFPSLKQIWIKIYNFNPSPYGQACLDFLVSTLPAIIVVIGYHMITGEISYELVTNPASDVLKDAVQWLESLKTND